VRALPGGEAFRAVMNTLDSCQAQIEAVATFFDRLGEQHVLLPSSMSAANDHTLSLAA
jgi:tRNA-dihydrouridine synthase B